MQPGGAGADDGYLGQAQSVCAHCERQGGRLVAWGDGSFAFGWPSERFDQVMGLVATLCAPQPPRGSSWAIGVAEGELEPLASDGSAAHLAWGRALVGAADMARAAQSGEVVVDDEVRALRAGRLALLGERVTTEGLRRLRGWRLDVEGPWLRPADGDESGDRATIPYVQPPKAALPPESPPTLAPGVVETNRRVARAEGSVTEDVPQVPLRTNACEKDGSPQARCRASLGAALELMNAGRCEDALLGALEALARGREAGDRVAVAACMALLAKLYDLAGSQASAAALRDAALGR
jgi:hypothetical protein